MIKNLACLEYKIGERVYQLLCDGNSPIPELRECLAQFLAIITTVENNAKQQAAEKAAQEQTKDCEECVSSDAKE